MREIKFRAWCKTKKEMLCLGTLIDITEFGWNYAYIEELEIMQFSGLHDRNGKEVWEGDVVKNDWRSRSYIVTWHDGSWRGKYKGLDFNKDAPGFRVDTYELLESEVIGNIFENSNLLKEV